MERARIFQDRGPRPLRLHLGITAVSALHRVEDGAERQGRSAPRLDHADTRTAQGDRLALRDRERRRGKEILIDPVMLCGRSFGQKRRRTTPHPTASNYNGTDCSKSPASRFPRRHAGIAADRSLAFMAVTSATGGANSERTIAAAPTCRWSSPLPPWAPRSDR
jgi:hypothetical protein